MAPDNPRLPGQLMRAEITEQPAVYARLIGEHAAAIRSVHQEIQSRGTRFVLLAARGSSDHAALYAKYLAEIQLQLPAGLISPSTYTVYGSRPDLSDVLFIAVSQSGASPDLVDSLTAARARGAFTIALTNAPGSPLATAADRHIDIAAGPEASVAATKTYTAELLALYLLLAPEPGNLAALPDAAEASLQNTAAVALAAGRYRYTNRIVTTGRGYSYPSAREAALKLMETCYLSAQAFSGADLLHGPLAMIDSGVPVIALAPPDAAGLAMRPVIEAIRASGADILTVGAGAEIEVSSAGLPAGIHPLLEILPLQQLALQTALDRGSDPDQPRGLSKVTETW